MTKFNFFLFHFYLCIIQFLKIILILLRFLWTFWFLFYNKPRKLGIASCFEWRAPSSSKISWHQTYRTLWFFWKNNEDKLIVILDKVAYELQRSQSTQTWLYICLSFWCDIMHFGQRIMSTIMINYLCEGWKKSMSTCFDLFFFLRP